MNIFRSIARALNNRTHDVAAQMDEGVRAKPSDDWRKKKLAEAAKKYGRPFRCAGEEMPRLVMLRGKVVTVGGGDRPVGM